MHYYTSVFREGYTFMHVYICVYTYMKCVSRKVVYYSQNTQNRASHHKRLTRKLSSFPFTGSSLLAASSRYSPYL